MTDQIERAREKLKTFPDEEIKEISTYIHEMKEKHLCAFCKHPGFIQVDDSAIIMCPHCFKILYENISSMKAFLGCK